MGGVITDTPNVKAATAQTATVRLSPSSSFLGYLMVSAPLSPARMRFLKSVRNLIPIELLSTITNSVLSITRQVKSDVKKCGAYMRMVVMTLVNRVESGMRCNIFIRGRCSEGKEDTAKGRG